MAESEYWEEKLSVLLQGSDYQVMRPIFVASELALTWGKIAEDNRKRRGVTNLDTKPLSGGGERGCGAEEVVAGEGERAGTQTSRVEPFWEKLGHCCGIFFCHGA